MAELPTDYQTKYRQLMGDDADEFFAAFDQPVVKAFRINPLKANQQLYDTPTNGQVPWGKWGYFGVAKGHSVDHTTGLIYSQEPSAQLVGELAQPQPGERVLDLAAAPGGKSTHLASFMNQQGLLVSNEIFRKRAQILSENIERFGVQNALVTNHSPQELSKKFPQYFDRIVLDAPCSGEGMFRKDPDAMQYWHKDYPAETATRQREILVETMKMLKPGGILVYSTCTFAPEEDEQIIAWLLAEYPDLHLVDVPKHDGMSDGRPAWADGNPELAKTVRLFPQSVAGEGHFMAKLQYQPTDVVPAKEPKLAKTNLTAEQRQYWEKFQQQLLPNYQPGVLLAFGDQLYAVPTGTPDLKGLQVLRAGLHLGTFKKKRFEPSLALALALHSDQFIQRYTLNDEEWRQYVHGDTFMLPSSVENLTNGWYLLELNGNGVGFGKLVNRQMKNFYPKGLRFIVHENQTNLADDIY